MQIPPTLSVGCSPPASDILGWTCKYHRRCRWDVSSLPQTLGWTCKYHDLVGGLFAPASDILGWTCKYHDLVGGLFAPASDILGWTCKYHRRCRWDVSSLPQTLGWTCKHHDLVGGVFAPTSNIRLDLQIPPTLSVVCSYPTYTSQPAIANPTDLVGGLFIPNLETSKHRLMAMLRC
jgi:hypothetical protein